HSRHLTLSTWSSVGFEEAENDYAQSQTGRAAHPYRSQTARRRQSPRQHEFTAYRKGNERKQRNAQCAQVWARPMGSRRRESTDDARARTPAAPSQSAIGRHGDRGIIVSYGHGAIEHGSLV